MYEEKRRSSDLDLIMLRGMSEWESVFWLVCGSFFTDFLLRYNDDVVALQPNRRFVAMIHSTLNTKLWCLHVALDCTAFAPSTCPQCPEVAVKTQKGKFLPVPAKLHMPKIVLLLSTVTISRFKISNFEYSKNSKFKILNWQGELIYLFIHGCEVEHGYCFLNWAHSFFRPNSLMRNENFPLKEFVLCALFLKEACARIVKVVLSIGEEGRDRGEASGDVGREIESSVVGSTIVRSFV